MRPLYINGQRETWIELEEPALKIRSHQQADQWYPLPRLSRIIVSGTVHWQTEALLACADHGITITFLTETGELRAKWLSRSQERQAFVQRLLDLLAKADGPDRYHDWYLSMERLAIRSLARRLVPGYHRQVTRSELTDYLKAQQQALSLNCSSQTYHDVRTLLHAHLLELSAQIGIDAELEHLHGAILNLPKDGVELIFWDFELPLLIWLEKRSTPPNHRDCIEFYETRKTRVEQLFRGFTNKLHIWLIGLN